MSLTLNMVGGGGGSLSSTDAVLRVEAPALSTVTISKGAVTKTDLGHENADDNSVYDYYFIIHQSQFDGVNPWTITATLGTYTATQTIIINASEEFNVSINYYDAVKAEIMASGLLLVSDHIGDVFYIQYSGQSPRSFTRTSNEPILCINTNTNGYWGYGAISFYSSLTGNATQYGSLSTPTQQTIDGITYYIYPHGSGYITPTNFYYTLDGSNYNLNLSTDYPHIDGNSPSLACTDTDKLNQVYNYIKAFYAETIGRQ